MPYSSIRSREIMDMQDAAMISDVARLANELQAHFVCMTRTDALKEADRLVRLHGIGVSLVK